MIRLRVTPFCVTFFGLTSFLSLSCAGDRTRSPTCGMAQLIGPSLIQDQLRHLPFVLTAAPRGLPATLPVRVAGVTQQSTVVVSDAKGGLTMEYQGTGFPSGSMSDSTGYALLVVDDSTQRAEGVLIYESRRPPPGYPSIGTLTAAGQTVPLYGVRVEWASVSNPKCPLLGAPPPTSPPAQ
jgi:hypothetical protein